MPSFIERMVSLRIPEVIRMLIANGKLQRQLKDWEHHPAFEDVRALTEDQLKDYLESEWTRAKELDDKLYKLTAALSVAVTVGGVVAKTILDGLAPTVVRAVITGLLFISMALFLVGAMIGFSGLRPKPRYGYGARFMKDVEVSGTRAKHEYELAVCGFQTMNLVRSNEATAAIELIRNGVIVFVLAIACSFFAPRLIESQASNKPSAAAVETERDHLPAPAGPGVSKPESAPLKKGNAREIVNPNSTLVPHQNDGANVTEDRHPQSK